MAKGDEKRGRFTIKVTRYVSARNLGKRAEYAI